MANAPSRKVAAVAETDANVLRLPIARELMCASNQILAVVTDSFGLGQLLSLPQLVEPPSTCRRINETRMLNQISYKFQRA